MELLHFLKLLEDNGLGTLNDPENNIQGDLYWQDMPIDANGNDVVGYWILSRGFPSNRFNTKSVNFDIYGRNSNKLQVQVRLQSMLDFMADAYNDVCDLPTIPNVSDRKYRNCIIRPTAGIQNIGKDSVGNYVFAISGSLSYKV